ncbi:MAG: hypothetical protein CSB55_06750 [Candidatus Cloacimonadota bacterium]|nr:MAG: hypothetical protein CSB55_06750 [Candidatus Cloacimonadota bacterium]
MKINKLVLVAILIIPMNFLFALHDDAGTSAFNFLNVNYSARAAAMGNSYTGLSDDSEALYYNPAGIVQIKRPSASVSFMQYFEGFQGGAASYAKRLNNKIILGAFTQYMTNGDIDKTEVNNQNEYIGKTGTFGASDLVLGISSAYEMNSILTFGLTAKFISESIDDNTATAFLADFGVLHQTTNKKLKLGISAKNFGTQLSYFTESKFKESMPEVIAVGFCYRKSEKLKGLLDICYPLRNNAYGKLGAEYRIHPVLDLRVGYKTNASDWKTGGDYELFSGMSFGFGLNWDKYLFDYAVSSYGDLGFVNQLTIKYNF